MRACETHGGRPVGVSESLSIHTRHSRVVHTFSLSRPVSQASLSCLFCSVLEFGPVPTLLSLAVASWRMLERFQPYVLDHFGDHVTVCVCVEHYTVLYTQSIALSLVSRSLELSW